MFHFNSEFRSNIIVWRKVTCDIIIKFTSCFSVSRGRKDFKLNVRIYVSIFLSSLVILTNTATDSSNRRIFGRNS